MRRIERFGRRPERRDEIGPRYARTAGEDRLDQSTPIERQLHRLTHSKIGEHGVLRAEAQHLDRVRGLVERLKSWPVGEPVERSGEVGLDGRRAGHVDLAASQRLDDRAAVAVEADLDPPEVWRATDVARERAQGHAEPGDPRRDRERTGVHRLAQVLGTPISGRGRENVRGQHAGHERVQLPPLSGAIREADRAIVDALDALDALGHPATRGRRRRGAIVVEREAHVLRGDRLAVLPACIRTKLERRHETSAGRRGVGHDARATVRDGRDVRRETRDETAVRVAPHE